MWSEATDSLTDVSLGNNGGGNTDACDPGGGWTTGCDVVPVLTGRGRRRRYGARARKAAISTSTPQSSSTDPRESPTRSISIYTKVGRFTT